MLHVFELEKPFDDLVLLCDPLMQAVEGEQALRETIPVVTPVASASIGEFQINRGRGPD